MKLIRVFLITLCALSLIAPAAAFADTSFTQYLGQLEQIYQLPSGLLAKVANIENGGKATGCATTSSACGMFQFTTGTWLSATKALYGRPLNLDLRNNPTQSAKVTAFELAEIKSQIGSTITQAKVDMSVGLYLGHFLGSGGARVFLNAYMQNPGQSACPLLPKSCAANRTILSQSLSSIINNFASRMKVPGVLNITGSFQDSNGTSYAYSNADVNASNFLPANTIISTDPQYDYPTRFTSVTASPAQLSPVPTLTGAPQTPLPASYTTPIQAAQALTSTAAAATTSSSSACAPRYYCSDNTDYYESGACVTTVFQQCKYGCLGTICAPQPSGTLPSTAAQATNSGNASAVSIGEPVLLTSTSSAVGSNLFTIVSIAQTGSSTPSAAASSSIAGGLTTQSGAYGQPTFTTEPVGEPYTGQTGASSQFMQLLDQLKSLVANILTYLQSL